MKKVRKLLYLLQLEEYQTDRYFAWLKKNKIEQLEERKGKLKWTTRIFFTFVAFFLLKVVMGKEKAIGTANGILNPLFKTVSKSIIFLAKIKLKLRPDIIKIVITGSYGKTTFKELLAFVAEDKFEVLKTGGNTNTAIGIAQIILKKLRKHHQILIVEAGAYQKGEIKEICQLVRPSMGVITVIGWMHLERFGTIDNIRQAKFELADFIEDKKLFFAPDKNHQFIDFNDTVIKICEKLGISKDAAEKRISLFKPPEHRLTSSVLNKNITVLDDAYNSNPLGFERALDELKKNYAGYQKIVVSQGMIELGDHQFELNRQAAEEAAQIADILVVVGQTNKEALTVPNQPKKFRTLYSSKGEKMEEILSPYLRPPTVILLENDLTDNYF